MNKIWERVREKRPLVHAITNHVSANDVANAILAVGGRPIMAEYIGEVEEITSHASALVLNMGVIHPEKLSAMKRAGKIANEKGIPIVLDPVGCMSSSFRRTSAAELLDELKCSVIRGNFAEMSILWNMDEPKYFSTEKISGGVDSVDRTELAEKVELALGISQKYCCVAIVTGAVDVVSDGKRVFCLSNGSPQMTKITGVGCMLSGLIGTFVGANADNVLESALFAVKLLSISGELAEERLCADNPGTASMRIFIIDYLSTMEEKVLEERVHMQEWSKLRNGLIIGR